MPTHLDRDSLSQIPEMGEHVATHEQYFSWFADTTKKQLQDNIDSFKKYLNAINQMFPQNNGAAFDTIHATEDLEDFHSDLLILFYLRVYKRILFTIKKRKVERANYFKLSPTKEDSRTQDLTVAIQEELQSAVTILEAKNAADKIILDPELDIDEVNEYKRTHHEIHIKKHALPFRITETILGAGTKINSTTKRFDTTNFFQPPRPLLGHPNPPHMANLHPPHMVDLIPKAAPNKQWGLSPTSMGFQITGIVFSGLWLIYNIFSLIYHKKKEGRKIFSFDNMREALPSLLFLPLGLVALLTPIGMWLSIVFAAHSILDTGYKIIEHIRNRNKVNQAIAENSAKIEELTNARISNASETINNVETFKNLDLANNADQASYIVNSSQAWQTGNARGTENLLAELTLQDKLKIEKESRTNNFAAFSYSTRTIVAIIGAVGLGLTLSFVPPLMFIGSMILVGTTCVTAAIFIPQIINRFYMIHKINKMKEQKMRMYGVDTTALFMKLEINFENFRRAEAENKQPGVAFAAAAAQSALDDIPLHQPDEDRVALVY